MCGAELQSLPDGVQRVARVLQQHGHPHAPVMLEDAVRTARQAADALGVQVGQIAKSIIFRRKADDAAVLVIASGDRRVDEKKVEALLGEGAKLGRADADFVKARTGFAIGGVSPVGHLQPPVTLIDRELFRFDVVWAAAGHPNGVFQLRPHDLERLTGAPVADVVQPATPGLDEAAIKSIAIWADSVLAGGLNDSEIVPSPCISICRMNPVTDWCEGCLRTRGEIAAWSQLPADGKRAVWARIAQRCAGLPQARA